MHIAFPLFEPITSAACSARETCCRPATTARTDAFPQTRSAEIEDAAIRAVVRMQEDIGLQGVTDGEYRRASWHMDFIYQIGGITKAQDNLKVQFHNEKGDIEFTPAAMRVTGKLKLREVHLCG